MWGATDHSMRSKPSTSTSTSGCHHFNFHEIQLATENFNESLVIGKGGFGKVYKGTIFDGSTPVVAAIKRLDSMSNQGDHEFWAEIETLSKLRHCNLVFLIGYCTDDREMILVYEFIPNGTLEEHLHKLYTPLSWVQRLKICIGAGRGLHYLHTGHAYGVIHRDVKSTNILLHENWEAKISDFGLSKFISRDQSNSYVNTNIKGTFGYLDPDYFYSGKLTTKSDVFAFGVVLLEVLCRKCALYKSLGDERESLVAWAQDSIKKGNLKHIVDSDIIGEISTNCLKEFVSITDRCLHISPKKRPTMAEVVVGLESVLILQEKANKSLQAGGKTIFRTALNMLPFLSKRENSVNVEPKLSSNRKSNNGSASNTLMGIRDIPTDFRTPNPSLKVFEYADLETSTRNFSPDMLLSKGSFGEAFIGWIDKNTFAPSTDGVGIDVAVKRRYQNSVSGHAKWLEEVSLLGQLAHPNITSLLGYCSDENKYFLVYEYTQNRSFDIFLFKNVSEPLSWETRLRIMIGVARGLTFLHSSKEEFVCSGVKSSDILLDQDFNAKLGEFGVARFCAKIRETVVATIDAGTFGYIDPYYYMTGQLSVKTDIYGLGVVLLETLTGLQAWDVKRADEQRNLVFWASPILSRGDIHTIMDPSLEQNYPLISAFKCGELALKCLAYIPKDRPSSKEVLWSLEQIHASVNK